MRSIRRFVIATTLALPLVLSGCGPSLDDEIEPITGSIRDDPVAAEAAARELLERVESRHGADSVEAARVIDVLVEAMWRSGKSGDEETESLALRAIRIKEDVYGTDGEQLWPSLNNRAIMRLYTGRFAEAVPIFDRALAIVEKTLGPEHPDAARILNGIGVCQTQLGKLGAARDTHERALAIRERAYEPGHALIAQSIQNLALVLNELGDFAGALRYAERSLEIKESAYGPDHPDTASALNTVIGLLIDTGAHDAARPFVERARAIYEQNPDAHGQELGAVLNNDGEVLRAAGDLIGARQSYGRALTLWEEVLGDDHPDLAIPLGNLGDVAERLDEVEPAIGLHERAVTVREAALEPDDFLLASSRHKLARATLAAGRRGDAEALFERVVGSLERSLGERHPQLAESLVGLGHTAAAGGSTSRAFDLALRSERIAREHRRLTGRSLSEARALRYADARESGLDLALTLAASGRVAGRGDALLDALVRSRAIVLDGVAARHRASLRDENPEARGLARRLHDARTQLAGAVFGEPDGSVEEYRDRLDTLIAAKERAERALAEASSEFAAELERTRIGLDDVRANLPSNSALVAFALFDQAVRGAEPAYLALVLRGGSRSVETVPIGEAATVDDLVAAWKREAVRGSRITPDSADRLLESYREHGTALRRAVWDPIAARIGTAKRVFVVPDGALNLVSWSSLPVGRSSYLLDDGPAVHLLSAERDLVPDEGRPEPGEGLLALGGVDYEADATMAAETATSDASRTLRGACAGIGDRRWEELPGAGLESRAIARAWAEFDGPRATGDAVSLQEAEARESAFKREAVGKRVLHLATHGFVLDDLDCSSGVEGTRGVSVATTDAPRIPVRVSPLLLSGLVLAGANRRDAVESGADDGILTAEEIAGLDLSRVEWAVLSACNTGVGEIRPGEGVFGLRRAARVAGVRSLIMSLWPVDDDATRAWMRALYAARFDQDHDTVESIRLASATVLRERREGGESTHPFFWAGFVGAGDWR